MIERKVKSVRALERGLDVLLEIHRSRAASLRELHHSTGLPKATLLRMLITLSKRGLVWQRLADGAFLPSRLHKAVDWQHADSNETLAELASPHLAELSHRIAWPSVLAVPRLDHVEIIETNSTINRLDSAMLGPIGLKLSYIHTATGRAYLAACNAVERAAIISRIRPADASAGSVAALDRIVAQIKARGYSERDPPHPWPDRNRAEVVTDGRRSIAVPVIVHGHAVAAINITWPGHRMQLKDVVAQHLSTLRATASAIGRAVEKKAGLFDPGIASTQLPAAALVPRP
jgi:IclR family mhp operon transcriptional activator